MKSLYEDLGVEKTATPEQIKAAHRKEAKKHHPDKAGGCREKFQRVQHAYDVLSDPGKRRHYDETGDDGSSQPGAPSPEHVIADVWQQVIERCDPETDLIAVLRQMLLDAARRADANEKAALSQLRKYEKILMRLIVDEDSVLRAVLQTKCSQQKTAVAMHKQAAALLNESVKLLDGSRYKHEPLARQKPRDDYSMMNMQEIMRHMADPGSRRNGNVDFGKEFFI